MKLLDVSALLALLNSEPGSEKVAEALESGASMSSVNQAEVAAKLDDYGMPPDEVEEVLASLDLTIVPFTAEHAKTSGSLRRTTKAAGLSLGDRACLALAHHTEWTVITADRHWEGLVDAKLEFIRPPKEE